MEKTQTLMEPSTLVLTACLQVHNQFVWDLYYVPFHRAETPEELVNAWYENAYAQLAN
jgi:hypothetical protein